MTEFVNPFSGRAPDTRWSQRQRLRLPPAVDQELRSNKGAMDLCLPGTCKTREGEANENRSNYRRQNA